MKPNALQAFCACLCLAACVTKASHAAPPMLTSAAYTAALGRVQTLLVTESKALSHAPATAPDTVPIERTARHVLAPFTAVLTPQKSVQPVDNTLLEEQIHRAVLVRDARARAKSYADAAMQLAGLRANLTGTVPDSPAAPIQISVRTILGQAQFDSDPLPPQSLWERFLNWLDRLFSRHHATTPTAAPISPAFIRALLILVAAGAFALLVAVLVQYLRGRTRPPAALALTAEEEALVEARDAHSLRALAEEQSQLGDWRRAFRLTYLAALVALDTHGVLRFDRAKTNWEYLRALRAAGQTDTYAALMPFTHAFDEIWYGSRRADAADYANAVAQYETLMSARQASLSVTAAAT